MKNMEDIQKGFEKALVEVESMEELESLRVAFLGRKSELSLALRSLGSVSDEERREAGPKLQILKKEITKAIEKKREDLERNAYDWEAERIDVTLPGARPRVGHFHPITKTLYEIEDIFSSMGFAVADGPEIETEFYNFDALNFPKDHPARDMQDAFWFAGTNEKEEKILPRTHTSNAQIHFMKSHTPPFRVIVPGRIFRNEATDASHEHTFHQFEALVVGDDVSVANFKDIGQKFFSAFFDKSIAIRLRPSFFPFTEPSFEFDISCTVCEGKGCSVCKKTGWIEVGGAGMVNQNVFVASGYDRNRYQGFAWGFGVERLAMMKYKIDDIRLFHSGDLRFIRQF
jgi:phenylalanyl-tRNA synthetase alpha chain